MNWPDVVAVIPVYQRLDFLGEALASVQAQDYPGKIDIVVVDDGSDTPVELPAVPGPHLIRLVRQPHRGLPTARRCGVDESSATLIASLDDDDLWEPAYLRQQVSLLRSFPEVGMVWSDVVFMTPGHPLGQVGYYQSFAALGEPAATRVTAEGPARLYARHHLVRHALLHEPAYPSASVFRREFLDLLGGYDPSASPFLESFDVFYRATRTGWVGFNDQVLVRIRRGHAQITSDLVASRFHQTRAFRAWARRQPADRGEVAPLLARRFLSAALRGFRSGEAALAAFHVWHATGIAATAPAATAASLRDWFQSRTALHR